MNILIADDDANSRKLLSTVLEAEGMTVRAANDGMDALALLEQSMADALISDLLMPRMDGYRLCRELRASTKYRDLPVIIYTATFSSKADEKLALDLGADRFIAKPASIKVLLEALRETTATPRRPPAASVPHELGLMKEYNERMVTMLEYTSIELEERAGLEALAADIGAALIGTGTLRQGLQHTAVALAHHKGIALAQIWALNQDTGVLELAASDGIHPGGGHRSSPMPVGRLAAVRILQSGEGCWSNLDEADGSACDMEWARLEGIAAFAGYPLAVAGKVSGVLEVMGNLPFGPALLQTLSALALLLSQYMARARAEAQLRDSKQTAESNARAAQAALEQLDMALTASATGTWSWDPVSGKMDWDGTTYRIFGLAPGSFRGGFQDFAALLHPEDRAAVLRGLQALSPASPAYTSEFRAISPDGGVSHLNSRGQAFFDDAGRLKVIRGVIRDITREKQIEEQLRQAQRMEAIGQLAGGVAHDFNNLLNVISGYSKLLLGSPGVDADSRRRVREIHKASEQGASLTRQLLAFSRKQLMHPQDVSLASTLADMDGMLRRLLGEDIAVEVSVDRELGYVTIDPGQAQQVILNLAVNARDAMPGGGKLALELRNETVDEPGGGLPDVPPGNYVVLSVSDNGHGMTPEVQKRVFEPFFTTKEPGYGTGLGLATVYGIVEQSGGRIRLQSQPGAGTVFKIFLPRTDNPRTEQALPAGEELARGAGTILLIEDNAELRELTEEVLSSAGYTVLAAEDGPAAFRLAERYNGEIRLLLTDYVLPGMNGKEIATRLAAARPDMKVLFMSGYTGLTIANEAGQTAEFIEKPWTPDGLCMKLKQLLSPAAAIQRILVVDDEPGIRSWLGEVLESAGYRILTAADGHEARDLAKENPVDLVITDLVMPREEGIEMIRALRKQCPQIKIIAMSGVFGASLLRAAELFGAHASLPKPLDADVLLGCIRRLSDTC